jgi:hypothetical protein
MLVTSVVAGTTVTAGSCRDFGYEANASWAKLPAGWSWLEVAAVATNSLDHAFIFNRGEHPVMIFDRDGTFVAAWGEQPGRPGRPRSISLTNAQKR